jgi:hypothetical protein
VDALSFAQKFVGRKLKDAGHRGDFAPQFFPGADEQRQNQLLDA